MMLTKRRQIQAVANAISGRPLGLNAEAMTPDFRWLLEVVQEAGPGMKYAELARVKADPENRDLTGYIDQIMAAQPGDAADYPSLDTLGDALPIVDWLWHGWLPRGYMTLLAAFPGVGKTYIALDLARRIIHGLDAPDGEALNVRNPVVVYVDAEDFLPVVNQRTKAWGMDRTRFYPLRRPPRELIDMNQEHYQDELVDMVYDLRPDLVIVDSLSSVNARGENNIEDLREVLSFFSEIPAEFDCAFCLIHHLRKPGKNSTQGIRMHDLRGSGHLVAMARVIQGLDTINVDDPNGPRVLKTLKNNLSRHPSPLGLTFESTADPDVARLQFGNINLFVQEQQTDIELAADWLVAKLEESGPLAYSELKVMIDQEMGFNESTLQRARKSLGTLIEDTLGNRKRGNQWALAQDDDLSEEDEG